jgi:hypothetical protein
MHLTGFHSISRYCPKPSVEIELTPRGPSYLTRASSRQDQRFQREASIGASGVP